MVWKELDTKTALKRLYILSAPFLVVYSIAVVFTFYQISLGFRSGFLQVMDYFSSSLPLV